MSFSENLKKILKTKKMSVSELSRRIDVPVTTLYSMLKRGSSPSLDMLYKISRELQCSLKELLQGESYAGYMPGEGWFYYFDEEEEKRQERLLAHFSELNYQGQEEAVKRVEELSEIEKYKKN